MAKEITVAEAFETKARPAAEVGVEVEAESKRGAQFPANVSWWNMGHDGSLRGNGVEYALKTPSSYAMVEKKIIHLYKKIGHLINPSDRAGVHVHLNFSHKGLNDILTFAVVYMIVENVLVKWCGEDREGNLFCLRNKDGAFNVQAILNAKAKKDLTRLGDNNYKYSALNFQSLGKFGTLEVRTLRTPTEAQIICQWVRMLISLRDYAFENKGNYAGLIEQFSMMDKKDYMAMVFAEDADALIACCGDSLDDILYEGLDMAQLIAYS